jgi:hypothetical protein
VLVTGASVRVRDRLSRIYATQESFTLANLKVKSQTRKVRKIRCFGSFVTAVLLLAATISLAGCGGSSISRPNPDKLATTIGAAWCEDSGFYLTNRLDGSKAEVFNCNMENGSYKCVSEEGGIANDVTAEFKASLATALVREADKPTCAAGS